MTKSQIKQVQKTAKEMGLDTTKHSVEELVQHIAKKSGNEAIKHIADKEAAKDDVIVIPADFKMKPGRPVDPTSKRQADEQAKHEHRLAIYKQKQLDAGMSQEDVDKITELPEDFKLQQGRPVVPGSARQQRLAEKGTSGTGKQGRPLNPTSERQKKLAKQMENRTKAYLAQMGITNPASVKVVIEAPKTEPIEEPIGEMIGTEEE